MHGDVTRDTTHVDLGSGDRVVYERRIAAPDVLEQLDAALGPLHFVQLVLGHGVIAFQHHGLAQLCVPGHDGRQLEQVFAI